MGIVQPEGFWSVEMRGETERQAEMLLRRLQELGEWQETTERQLIAEQKQELVRHFPQPVGNENDTEDDTTVSSMEFDNENEEELQEVYNEKNQNQEVSDSINVLNVSSATGIFIRDNEIQKWNFN